MCSKNPSNMFKSNIDGTKSMLSLGNSLKIKKFVYTSSAVTLGEQHGTVGSETSEHRGRFLSKYEESKYLAEKEAFEFTKDYEFVSINPSSVQGPGRVSGTAKLLISTLNRNRPPLIKTNISIVYIHGFSAPASDVYYIKVTLGAGHTQGPIGIPRDP